MAVPNFKVTQNTGGLTATFEDLTTWGVSPAPPIAALVSELTITPVNLTDYTLGTAYPVIDMLALFGVPGAASTAILNSTYFGQVVTDKIPDGIYQFDWYIENDEAPPPNPNVIAYSTTWFGYFKEGLICCYFTRIAQKLCCCNGRSKFQDKTVNLKIDIDYLGWAEIYCPNNVDAAAALQEGADICSNNCESCSSCGGCC